MEIETGQLAKRSGSKSGNTKARGSHVQLQKEHKGKLNLLVKMITGSAGRVLATTHQSVP